MYEVHNFTKIGDAGEELRDLYAKGWRLITVVAAWAVSVPESKTMDNNHFYAYAIEYFLERQI